MRRSEALLCGALVAAMCTGAALAVEPVAANHQPVLLPRPAPHPRQSFADMVRELVARGEVRPLKEVLDVARKASPGEIVGVKLRHQKPHWVYHVRVLREGRRTDLDIDGKSLKILERK